MNSEESYNYASVKTADIRNCLIYFAIYFVSIFYWEAIIRILISGQLNTHNISFVVFVPAEALFLTALTGFAKKRRYINNIVNIIFMLLLVVFYGAQTVYYMVFGSVLSVNLLGMGGEATGNFAWAIGSVIKTVFLNILILLVPLLLVAVISFVKPINKKINKVVGAGYTPWFHAVVLVVSLVLWFGGIFGLKAMGTERGSAYYVMTNKYSDSDSTAERIGVLPTTIVEAAARYLGISISSDSEEVAAINNDALNMMSGGSSSDDNTLATTDVSGENAVADAEAQEGNASTDNAIEEIEEEIEILPYINDAIDFELLSENATNDEIRQLCDYYGSKSYTTTNEYTGIFEGYNLIYICIESFSSYAIDPDVTPLLYEMSQNGIVLTNYYNSFKNTTSNGEFAFAASYWPDVSRTADNDAIIGSFPQSAKTFIPYGLGDFFNSIDVPTYAYHDFWGSYYKRKYTWPNLGYQNLKFLGEGMNFTNYWPAPDTEMFEQSVDDFIEDDQFHAYYMTFSGHGPFASSNYIYRKHIDVVKELAGDKYTDDGVLGYLCGAYEFELGLEYLVQRLEEAGKLDNTVFVMTGDHYPYYLSKSSQAVFAEDTDTFNDFDIYKSTCIIYNSAIEEPIINDEYCCNVDILPTVLNLFGFEFDSRLLAGIDVFSDGIHRARLYNGNFLTKYVWYNAQTGEYIWQEASSDFEEEQLIAYADAMVEYTSSEYAASLKSQSNNFLFYVWQNSGLLSDEEVQAEKNREANIKAIYQAIIEAEEEKARQEQEQAELEAAMREQGLNPDGTPIEQ